MILVETDNIQHDYPIKLWMYFTMLWLYF